jgi:hypothetical protein
MGERLCTMYQFQGLLNHKGAALSDVTLTCWRHHHYQEDRLLAEACYVGVVPRNP